MISICVPVYNTDVRPLAFQLSVMAERASFSAEILFFDDFSALSWHEGNRETAALRGVVYRRMEKNLGRGAIRNHLARAARYPWLLFLDADSLPASLQMLEQYAAAMERGPVICGGTVYSPTPPDDPRQLLRWRYGRKREQRTARQREKEGKFAITANNFLIKREVFLNHPFRESIRGYGHEDTVLGYDLRQAGIPVCHTDNPVFHTGLESSADYLEKTKAAVGNLWFISRELIRDPHFNEASGLLRMVDRMKRYGLRGIAASLFRGSESLLRKNLTGPHPSLLLFDLYRTGTLCSLAEKAPSQ